ncbi:electron transport complex subunit RsxC [Lutispora saccharofermentans]|uniref:electron transport complex subunit RsxC n=1 Tax=Lutispora saccharofermentans TaxID=3024236 RepID=UPI0026EDA6CF|nr:electron transport complex subunit RsxC [Lutispora saccharofermentans]
MNIRTLSFKGGTHPPHSKEATEKLAVIKAKSPEVVVIPMQQHIGAPCEPTVKVGDEVKVGQKIGEAKGFVSSPIHSSVSGKVISIEPRLYSGGTKTTCVVIQNDMQETLSETVTPKGDIENLSSEQLKEIIKDAGIVGMGGATFPTHVKLALPPGKTVDTIILNGAECEPYLTSDHRLMLENPEAVVFGLKALMKALNVNKGFIGIETNKPDALEAIYNAAKDEKGIEVVALKTKYPQGAEKQLIYACTGREVPSGGLPADVGVVVNNVGTAAAIADAVRTGMPLIQRIVTVTGKGVKTPKNLLVKVGTSFREVIDECGGFSGSVGKVIAGGPMMGIAQFSIDIPVIKGTSGILVLAEEDAKLPEPSNCIRCGKCVTVCPIDLMPLHISNYSLQDKFDQAEEVNAMDCIECGSCSFVCPAKRPLVDSIRVAKREILAKRKKAQSK